MYDYRIYLEYSEKHIQMAEEELKRMREVELFLIPSILLSWIAVEFFINNMLDDFGSLPEDLFELHERAFLLEKKLIFKNHGEKIGNFILDQKEYRRLEDKIFFLISKFSPTKHSFRGDTLWQNFESFKDLRNKIMHPRKQLNFQISIEDTIKYHKTAIDIIKFVSSHVWGRPVQI